MDEKITLRSSDGLLFEVDTAIACLSPIIAELHDLHDSEDEVPLPMVRSSVLTKILQFCERYACKGQWDPTLLQRTEKTHEDLEELACAANYLCLEQLMALCLRRLAQLVKEEGSEQTCVSVKSMRRILQMKSVHIPNELVAVVLEGLGFHAVRGDVDAVNAIHLYLDHNNPVVCKSAISAVGRLAPEDDAASMAHLHKHLGNRDMEVQLAAFSALTQVAARGNEQLIGVIKQKSVDGHPLTRCAAMEAAKHIEVHGDASAIANVRRGMSDSNGSVRKAALSSYSQLAKQGDRHASLDLIRCLEDMDSSVRQAAIEAVTGFVDGSNLQIFAALSERLEHQYFWVSWAAAKALGDVAPKDDPTVIDAIVSRLGHGSASTRQVSLQVLAEIASKGNERVIEGLTSHLQHHDKDVRRIAVKAFEKFGKGETRAVGAATKLLEHHKNGVRKSALQALKLVATKEQVQEELRERVRHKRSEVRLWALSSIPGTGSRNEHWVVEALCRGLLDRDEAVQKTAASAFDKMVDKGNPYAIFNLLGLLDAGGDGHGLQAILRVLPKVAGHSEESLSLVGSLLEKHSINIRNSLFDAFMQMSDKSYRPCTFAVCTCWEHADIAKSQTSRHLETPDTDLGTRVATQALTSCLLQPGARLQDAVRSALRKSGASGDHAEHVAMDLDRCMSCRRWFIRWQTVEFLCRSAMADGAASCSTTIAKGARRTCTEEDENPSCAQPMTLHRHGCPCLTAGHSKRPSKRGDAIADGRPSKRARLAGA